MRLDATKVTVERVGGEGRRRLRGNLSVVDGHARLRARSSSQPVIWEQTGVEWRELQRNRWELSVDGAVIATVRRCNCGG